MQSNSAIKIEKRVIMYRHVGRKIMVVAKIFAWIGIIACILGGLGMMAMNSDLAIPGIVLAVVGSLLSWVNSFVLCGFGQLIDNTDELLSELEQVRKQQRQL